jgi:hypothetical protein
MLGPVPWRHSTDPSPVDASLVLEVSTHDTVVPTRPVVACFGDGSPGRQEGRSRGVGDGALLRRLLQPRRLGRGLRYTSESFPTRLRSSAFGHPPFNVPVGPFNPGLAVRSVRTLHAARKRIHELPSVACRQMITLCV